MAATTEQLPTGEEKARVVEEMFDRIAPRYDLLNRLLTFRMDVGWRRTAVAALDLAPGARVIDLACGTGDLCRTLEAAGHAPIGIDFSAGMLAAANTDAPLVRATSGASPGVNEPCSQRMDTAATPAASAAPAKVRRQLAP